MQATIGKYTVSIEKTRLICTHPTGISFDLTLDEALGLMRFIAIYQDAILAAQQAQQSSDNSSEKVKDDKDDNNKADPSQKEK